LSSSGLLVKTVGGPSVKGYQPPGLWEASTSGRGILATYKQDHGADLYRRGLYSFIKRTLPPPSLIIFDASNRDQCEVRRTRTNTPLQALVMLNDPVVLEASRVLSVRLLQESGSMQDKIAKAFRIIVCRKGTAPELQILNEYFTEEQHRLQQHPDLGAKLLTAGEYPLPQHIDVVQTAAMAQVIAALYNLEETITKS